MAGPLIQMALMRCSFHFKSRKKGVYFVFVSWCQAVNHWQPFYYHTKRRLRYSMKNYFQIIFTLTRVRDWLDSNQSRTKRLVQKKKTTESHFKVGLRDSNAFRWKRFWYTLVFFCPWYTLKNKSRSLQFPIEIKSKSDFTMCVYEWMYAWCVFFDIQFLFSLLFLSIIFSTLPMWYNKIHAV